MRFASPSARRLLDSRSFLFSGAALFTALAAALSAAPARADGFPRPGQMTFEEAVTPIAHEMHAFHDFILLPIIVGICLFVLALLGWIYIRYNENKNPVATTTTHNSLLEVAWTVLPVMILVIIAIPSFRLLTHQLVIPPADITVKATGKQWFWTYDYPKDQGGGFSFDSYLIPESDLKPGDIRQLSVDNEAVVPVGKVVHMLVTGADVIHSFTIPSFGIRIDAVPGRMNETWFKAEREGIYYGQCSKLCGKDHAYMPIAIRVVSPETYSAWLVSAAKKFAANNSESVKLANNATSAGDDRETR
ncbi:cytochrome c oxidase, subunit II [Methylocella silvestris BL2]|uniref:Cytochrome c oxidase subunit 2 n=1 Tax=Methylocella silvestris (strain DSM 15510 / CIP 108128 / LMG 27833 / NCIMB 13906 / BL2) TaxID=395965 RepID=B8EPK1_METSB|nr:cytochrome c oxidase subunit II [Methylocella silvestris]ACK50206.1 cytochrome c oxidase, subunit II [Methylocella silvestris BL2]